MDNVASIAGGDGVPPEPNWNSVFGRKDDRASATLYWGIVMRELRDTDKLAVANAHQIKRLVIAYVMYDIAAKNVARMGSVIAAPKTKVPTYNPWWTTMQNAASDAASIEAELTITPRRRNAGGKVVRKAKRTTGADAYLKPRTG